MNYVAKRAAIILFNKYLDEKERSLLITRLKDWHLDPNLSRCLNVQVAVISSDHKFMFSRRSSKIINGGKVACGIAETMEDSDRTSSLGEPAPDIMRAALRGLLQEAGIDVPASNSDPQSIVRFVSLMFDTEYYEPQFIGVADFRAAVALRENTKAEDILFGLLHGAARDKWENREIVFTDFTRDAVMRYAAQNNLTAYGLVAAIQALQHEGHSFDAIQASYVAASTA